VRQWVDAPPEKWSVTASLAGGAAAGVTLAVLAFPNQLDPEWYEPFATAGFGAVSYVVLGWLIQYQVKTQRERQ
jgi:hypothetical protein